MQNRFAIFTAIIWQPALPEKPVETELVGNAIRTYVTGKLFPEDWFFRADFDREGAGWQIEDSSSASFSADAGIPTSDPKQENSSNSVKSQLLEEYAASDDRVKLGSYVDLETVKNSAGSEFEQVLQFMERNPQFRILLVEITDSSDFEPRDWRALGALELEIHFVRKTRFLADDGHSEESVATSHLHKGGIDNSDEETS